MSPPDLEESRGDSAELHPRESGEGNGAPGPFPIVGIGGSAGGIEAMCELLGAIRPDAGVALLLVLHLDPSHDSMLTEILGSASKMPVVLARDGLVLELNRAYVIPPNVNMQVVDGRIRLTMRGAGLNMPIDVLFRSMALELGPRSIGVVLSGGGSDGAMGIKEIKSAGGITIVQDETTARHDSMPRCAVGTGFVDHILSPSGIGIELSRIGHHPFLNDPDDAPTIAQTEAGATGLKKIFELIRSQSGVDFSKYKSGTILRRIQRRMVLRQEQDLSSYTLSLQDDPGEVKALYNDFLIRVTHFFRDPATFEALQRLVFPRLLRERKPGSPIRIWVAGCATGEEVYSLAIALMEMIGETGEEPPIKILATDISERYLEIARTGTFIDNIALDVSPERLKRYFHKVDGKYQISKSIRNLCVFSRHDVSRDPPFARLDLISCRNLLIYLDLASQKRILPLYHYALRPGGYLLLGPSETIGSYGDLFESVDPDHKIFTRRPGPPRNIPSPNQGDLRSSSGMSRSAVADDTKRFDRSYEAVRNGFTRDEPACIVIDEASVILEVRGPVGPYLQDDKPEPGANLVELARPGLAGPLKSTLAAAITGDSISILRGIHLEVEDRPFRFDMKVIPAHASTEVPRRFLVLFERQSDAISLPVPPPELLHDAHPSPPAGEGAEAQLRREIQLARTYLQSVIEVHESTIEELKSANEEILSSNEELRSTNEELQTGKEDIQSANEEMLTVNDELNHRNRELARTNDDLINIFGSTSIPIVMVNRELAIRRFTTAAEEVLNLIPADIGRPIGNIRPNFEFADLDTRIAEVIGTLAPQDHEVRDRDGHWYSVRIRPYITVDNRIDGAVIAVVDINAMKQITERLRITGEYADAIVEAVFQPLVVLDTDLQIMRANGAFYRAFHASRSRTQGRSLFDVVDGHWEDRSLLETLHEAARNGQVLKEWEIEVEFKAGDPRTFLLNAQPIAWEGNGVPMTLLSLEDITDRKRNQEHTRQLAIEQAARAEAELANRQKDEFLALLAHELRNPLAPILNALLVLRTPGTREGELDWAREIMERQVRHMVRLVDDLLDVSRVIQGKIQLRRERVDLGRLVSRTVEVTGPFLAGRSHHLEVKLPSEPIVLDADPVRIEQVLVNLLTNSAKYTENGGRISLSVMPEGDAAVIKVRDNGVGLTPDSLSKIFDLFIQADHSLDRSVGGLGIGLTLVRTLVELHNGSVTAHSEGLGRGSEFVVRLPMSAGSMSRDLRLAPGAAKKATPYRLLLVEDNIDSANSLGRLLQLWGHDVRIAHDGIAGLQEAQSFLPEIILLDVGLPGLDGYQVASRLRLDPATADVVLIALTGYGQAEDRRLALQAGFDYHLVKPVDADQLRILIERGRRRPE
jgi:two-component system CheB/CheR fusion protein